MLLPSKLNSLPKLARQIHPHWSREDLVGRLKDDQAIFEVLEQAERAWFDAERVKPECKDAGCVFAFGVEIFDSAIAFSFLFMEGARPDQVLKRLVTKTRLRQGFPDEG